MRTFVLLVGLVVCPFATMLGQDTMRFTHADTLRGSITPQRGWWDVTFYDLHVAVDPADSSMRGYTGITYRVVGAAQEMQIDLQRPMEIDSVVQEGGRLAVRRDGDAFFVTVVAPQTMGAVKTVMVFYHGKPHVAKKAPWEGGVVWARDSLGHPWIGTACQGAGASVWWPNKDTQADEPDSQRIAVTVPDSLVDISNGRLRSTTHNADGTATYEWFVQDPINNYDVAVNVGKYAHISDVYRGEQGELTLDFWPLAYHVDTAKTQFRQVSSMLRCFEWWFGAYPWYRDGYKLVETPYLGMDHQSAIAYGNHYMNGYRGKDLSHTGWGLRWDFIIVHESAHEWFGNSITSEDVADMWVHESFANYAEGLYTECLFGKRAGAAYVIGLRNNIANDQPIVDHYGVQEEGSGDMYYKGSNMLHMMRQIVGNDTTWRTMLRGLNREFWHRVVTGAQVQRYINQTTGRDFGKVFQQYLTTTKIPVLEYRVRDSTVSYRWGNAVAGFDMPVLVTLAGRQMWLTPAAAWRSVVAGGATGVRVDDNFLVTAKRVE